MAERQKHKFMFFRVSPRLKQWFVELSKKEVGGKQHRLFMKWCIANGYEPSSEDF